MAVVVLGLLAACQSEPPPAPNVSEPAPDFELPSLDGNAVSLSSLRGSPVMLNFWATWSSPCRSEMPYFQEVYEESSGTGLETTFEGSAPQLQPDTAAIRLAKTPNATGVNEHPPAARTGQKVDRPGIGPFSHEPNSRDQSPANGSRKVEPLRHRSEAGLFLRALAHVSAQHSASITWT